jgi:predicted DNA-binding transcriptional regulator AlpA
MTASQEPGEALTEVALARWLGLSVSTIRDWRRRGVGPSFVKFGRAVRYFPADIAKFIHQMPRAD